MKPSEARPVKDLVKRYFIFKFDDIQLRRATIIGEMGSGKTMLALRLAEIIRDAYGDDNVNIIAAMRLDPLIRNMDNRKVQILILDDPLYYHFSSGLSLERKRNVSKLARIRHIYESISGRRSGLIVFLVTVQYFFVLDPFFRNTPLLFFKTVLNDPRDRYLIRKLVGPQHYMELAKLTFRIYFREHSEKARTLAKPIGHKPVWVKYSLPTLRLKDIFIDEHDNILQDTIYSILHDEKDIEILRLRLEGKRLQEIARNVKLDTSQVSRRLKRIRRQLGILR